ncbi:HupE/UreJ family protein [Roseomonas eburnea]|uniref:HupE/UreJ family protein n=1 Tax=Neoroseomonas eburnea TaxID=1346889 RepID=A0A9X9X5U2_9PROT|nr:HupE/UreJ family protein [Neoroseomonas eburnea]MBR0679078.1 HupE/UreJ family protein [Neoroseomonas eburnea]
MTLRLLRACALILPTLAAGPAFAHGVHTEGLGAGFAHPLLGLDHLVAMIAIGLWAAQSDFARAWALPAAFLGGMAAGIGLGLLTELPAWIEPGVAATVLVLGLVVALAVPMGATIALPLAAAFGLLHGAAHGGEIGGSVLPTALGMLAASAVLHAAGFAMGRVAAGRVAVLRVGGAAIAASGVALIIAAG